MSQLVWFYSWQATLARRLTLGSRCPFDTHFTNAYMSQALLFLSSEE